MTRPLLVIADDDRARGFAPFSTMRAWGAMVVGALPVHERWAAAFPEHDVRLAAPPWLEGMLDAGTPPMAGGVLPAGTIVAHSRAAVSLAPAGEAESWTILGATAAVRLAGPIPVQELATVPLDALAAPASAARALSGQWIEAPWDVITHLNAVLEADLRVLGAPVPSGRPAAVTVLGDHPVVIDPDAHVEPFVVFDAHDGPVVVRAGARIAAFTRIAGPCYIAHGAHLLGGRISGSVIGPGCRIHGDVSASVFAGYANKAHEGFVGHSVVGRWANLGAGTTTSNLKNSYGPVRAWTPNGERDTGLTFLGSLIGDHAKLGIGTMLATGTVIGAGANVFGTRRPPKVVPPFAWGDAPPYETFSREKFLVVAERVMQRRGVAMDAALRQALGRAYDAGVAGQP